MRPSRSLAAIAVGVAFLGALGPRATAAPRLDRLVYASTRQGNTDLWAANVDGTDQRALTTNLADDAYPDVSHNGRMIAFMRGISRNCSTPYYGHLWVMNADGTGERQLLKDDLWNDFRPDFSPDGQRILFSRAPAGRGCAGVDLALWVINVDGRGLKQVKEHATFGSWSPDGERIVYGSEFWSHGTNIWVSNADGADARPLTTLGGVAPQWSPDGTRIAFTSSRRAGKGDVWVMDADGSKQHFVTASTGKDGFATWSPDSRRIAFASSRHSSCPAELAEQCPHRVYTMAANGSDVRRVADNADYDILPAYFPRASR